jgi:hypothetical protein
VIQIANGGGLHPARKVVGGDFLHLVRFGIRHANDPLVRDSIEVIASAEIAAAIFHLNSDRVDRQYAT